MSMPVTTGIFIIIAVSSLTLLNPYLQFNQVINTNGSVDDFLKSLPSDSTILAELVCQNAVNETIVK